MPLGYCTRPACADDGQSEDKLRTALAELVENLDTQGGAGPELRQRSATEDVDLGRMFDGSTLTSSRFCPACTSPIGTGHHVCTACGHLLPSAGLKPSQISLNLVRSLSGFPGQSLALPGGKCRLTIDHQGLAMVTRMGQRALVEFEPSPGGALSIIESPGFGLHIPLAAPTRLDDRQTLRLGQQLLVVSRSPLGTYPRAGSGSREDLDTRLAAPALRRAPWYLHRLLPNGSVGELTPLHGSLTLGGSGSDIDVCDSLVVGDQATFDVSDELHLIPEPINQVWLQGRSGQTLMPSSQVWIGDAIYRLERRHE
jgi:hypothetical protein